MVRKQLRGLKVAVLAADGFEQVELSLPRRRLERLGAEVEVVSLRRRKIRGMKLLVPGRKVKVARTVAEADPGDYHALLIPGGFMGPDLLRQSREALEFVQGFDLARKPIAVLCHGPWVLVSAGLVGGRQLTSWPGIQDDVRNAGGVWRDVPVVREGNWVSARGPQDLPSFLPAMVALFHEAVPAPAPARKALRQVVVGGLALGAAGYALRRTGLLDGQTAQLLAGDLLREGRSRWRDRPLVLAQ